MVGVFRTKIRGEIAQQRAASKINYWNLPRSFTYCSYKMLTLSFSYTSA
jgi:hypothetical protein